MPLWGTTDQNADKPKWLTGDDNADKPYRKSEALGVDTDETAANEVGHAGWNVPAGGTDNTAAQKECIVTTRNITGDNDALGT